MRPKEIILTVSATLLYIRSAFLYLYLAQFEIFSPFTIASLCYCYENTKVYRYSKYESAFIPLVNSIQEYAAIILLLLAFCCNPDYKSVELLRLHLIFFIVTKNTFLAVLLKHFCIQAQIFKRDTLKPTLVNLLDQIQQFVITTTTTVESD